MGSTSLMMLVIILGLRHGLDAENRFAPYKEIIFNWHKKIHKKSSGGMKKVYKEYKCF